MTNISVVIPVFNEDKNIPKLYHKLKKVLNKLSKSHEIIFIDDGSKDASLERIKSLRKKDKKVKAVCFSRNFGHMSAVSAGLSHARGRKVVIMDADLQDPPELIEKLYEKSKSFDVVYAVKKKRKENFLFRLGFRIFYAIQTRVSVLPIPANAGTFSLIDQKVAKIITGLPEKNKFFSGLRAWSGFSQTHILYSRDARHSGKRKSLSALAGMALDGIFSFSYAPLRLASFLGFLLAGISLILASTVVAGRIFFNLGIVGWASTLTTVLFIGSVQLITLGIIGEYLARIYDEVKGRPEYIISGKMGIK